MRAEWFVENKFGVIGTPDDAIALIERLYAKQGDFGAFLQQAHNWADWEATKRSYELYARYVMPHFSGDNRPRVGVVRLVHGQPRRADREAVDRGAGDVRQARGRAAAARGGAAAAEGAGGVVGAGGLVGAVPGWRVTAARRRPPPPIAARWAPSPPQAGEGFC